MKDLSFTRSFRPQKSVGKNSSGKHQAEKRGGRLVWDSKKKGTYIKAVHGELE